MASSESGLQPPLNRCSPGTPEQSPNFAAGLATVAAPLPKRVEILSAEGDSASGSGSSGFVTFVHPDGDVTCPKFIGDYEILGLLGRGGMGNVFLARNQFFGRQEALKMLHKWFDSPEARELFVQEMQTQAGLDHRNITKVHYAGRFKDHSKGLDQLYFVMSLEAGDLSAKIKATGPLPPAEAAQVVRRVAKAIAHAHSHAQKVIHCDLKPKNILIGKDGTPKVTDFGLVRLLAHPHARRAGSGRPFGTPAYMPPEQAEGNLDQVNEQSDVYGLGAVLYELLTAHAPYQGRSGQIQKILDQVLDPNVKPRAPRSFNPAIPQRLEDICLKCLSKLPADRYRSAHEVGEALDRFVRPPLWKRRWREVAIATLCGGFAWVATWLVWKELPSPRAVAAGHVSAAEQYRADHQLGPSIVQYTAAAQAYDGLLDGGLVVDRERMNKKRDEVKQRLTEVQEQQTREQQDEIIKRARKQVKDAEDARREGRRVAAVGSLKAAQDEYERLAPGRRADPAYGPEAALALALLAELQVEGRNWPDAQQSLEAARKTLDAVTPAGHENAILARAEVEHIWGVFYSNQDNIPKARDHFAAGLGFRRRLEKTHSNPDEHRDFLRDLARSYGYLGDAQLTTGQLPQAKLSYQKAEEVREQLAAAASATPAAHCLHARDFTNRAGWYEFRAGPGDLDKAAALYRERLGYLDKHVERLPKLLPGGHLTERADTALGLAELLLDRPEPPLLNVTTLGNVATLLEQARDEYEQLLQVDEKSVKFQSGAARMHLAWGRYYHRQGEPDNARKSLDVAAALLTKLEDDGAAQAEEFYHMAVIEALIAEFEKTTTVDRLIRQMRALDLLRKAVRMKYQNATRLDRDHALKSLASGHPKDFAAIRQTQQKLRDELKGTSGVAPVAVTSN